MRVRGNVFKLVVRHPIEAAHRFSGQLELRNGGHVAPYYTDIVK